MEITIEREHQGDELVFTIRVKDCSKIKKSVLLQEVEYYEREFDYLPPLIGESIKLYLNDVKDREIDMILGKTRFHIDNQLIPRIKHICQEIYNWIYDHQDEGIQNIMNKIERGRTKYYFDNDAQATKNQVPQESEHDDEDWDDEDSDDN